MPEILESILVIILDPIHSCWLHFVDVDRIWIGCPGSFREYFSDYIGPNSFVLVAFCWRRQDMDWLSW